MADRGQGQEALDAVQAALRRPLVGVPPWLGSQLCGAILPSARVCYAPGPHDVDAARTRGNIKLPSAAAVSSATRMSPVGLPVYNHRDGLTSSLSKPTLPSRMQLLASYKQREGHEQAQGAAWYGAAIAHPSKEVSSSLVPHIASNTLTMRGSLRSSHTKSWCPT